MKFLIHIFLLSFIFISCGKEQTDVYKFDKDIYTPGYSSNFKIEGNENSDNILISVFNPWQGAENVSSLFLIQRDSIPIESFKGQILKGNAKRIICMSSTHIAMLEALGATDKIVGVSGKQYISNPKIKNSGPEIPDIGYEGFIDYEKIVAVDPDLILLFSVNGASSMEPKLKELGIPYIYIGDYVEEDPLGKVEWIVPLAELIGKREIGINIYQKTVDKYNVLKEKVKENKERNPKIMVNAPFLDSWFMPSTESYVAKMIKDAGGDYVYKKNTGNSSKPIDMEEALQLVSLADYWINIGNIKSINELKTSFPKLNSSKCILQGQVYNNNKIRTPEGGNDCYESGVMNPDLVLRDLIKIFHPDLIQEEFVYYQKLQ